MTPNSRSLVGGEAFTAATQCIAHEILLEYQRKGEIGVPLHRIVPFAALPEGLEDLAQGRVMGKAVLAV